MRRHHFLILGAFVIAAGMVLVAEYEFSKADPKKYGSNRGAALENVFQSEFSISERRKANNNLLFNIEVANQNLASSSSSSASSSSSSSSSSSASSSSSSSSSVAEAPRVLVNKDNQQQKSSSSSSSPFSSVQSHFAWFIEQMNVRGRELRGDCDDPDFVDTTLVKSYLNAKRTLCDPMGAPSEAHRVGQSDITCYSHTQARHTAADSICEGHNLALTSSMFHGERMTAYVEATWMSMDRGGLQASCEYHAERHVQNQFPLCLGDWFGANGALLTSANTNKCDKWIEHPVYFLTRNNNLNTYHSSEDWTLAYMVWAALELPIDQVEVVFVDLQLPGPYNEMWTKVFARKQTYLTEWRNEHAAQGIKTVCLRHAIFNPPGSGSPISKDKGLNSRCRDNALVQAFANFTLESMDIHKTRRDPKLRLVFISRKDYKGLGTLKRKINNELQVAEALERELGHLVVIERLDFAEMSWVEQLTSDINADILLGVHGAGMTHLMFLPPWAAVIEMFIPGTSGNRHYHNLANWTNKKYYELNVDVTVDVNAVVNTVKAAIEVVKSHRQFNE